MALRNWTKEDDFLARSQAVLDEHEQLKSEAQQVLEGSS